MAIKAYVGIMGSGKTYEVASVVIYNALKEGRRVVSNIAGLDVDEYYRLLELDGYETEKLGKIVKIEHDTVFQDDFWLNDIDFKAGKQNFIQAGDLLVLDEIWRFWDGFSSLFKDSTGKKMPDTVMNFFRMHRQFPNNQTGLTCDIAFITQDVTDFSRKLRGVIEETYRMSKLSAVGSTKRYRIDVFHRAKITSKPMRQLFGSYDVRYFGLYQSHVGKEGGSVDAREVNIDKRGNILSSKFFIFGVPLCLIVLYLAYGVISKFFTANNNTQSDVKLPSLSEQQPQQSAHLADSGTPSATSNWRVVGLYNLGNLPVLLLVDANGQSRHVTRFDSLSLNGLDIEAVVDGQKMNTWSNLTRESVPQIVPTQ
jgi:zona occludens toxin